MLACGPGALSSHESAASLWGFLRQWRGPMHVTAGRRRERPGVYFNLRRMQPDAYFPEHNLIVELDGWNFRKDRQAFETDREAARLKEILDRLAPGR